MLFSDIEDRKKTSGNIKVNSILLRKKLQSIHMESLWTDFTSKSLCVLEHTMWIPCIIPWKAWPIIKSFRWCYCIQFPWISALIAPKVLHQDKGMEKVSSKGRGKKKKCHYNSSFVHCVWPGSLPFFFFLIVIFVLSFIKMQCPLVESIWASFPSLPDNING